MTSLAAMLAQVAKQANKGAAATRSARSASVRSRPVAPRTIAQAARVVSGQTRQAAGATRTARRQVARTPPAQAVDPAFLQLQAQVARYEASKRAHGGRAPAPASSAGFANPAIAQLAAAADLHRGSAFGGFLQNLGRGAVDTLTGLPSAAQLVGENVAAYNPLTTGLRGLSAAGVPGLGGAAKFQNRVAGLDKAAAKGVIADYKYRYGPLGGANLIDLVTGRGQSRHNAATFGKRFYDNPLPTLLDVAGAYSAIGRAPNALARAAVEVAPESRLGIAGARRLSIAPAAERAEGVAGARFRPSKVRMSAVRAKGGEPGVGRIEVPRRPYSPNIITRAVQKGVDRLGARVVPRIERAAESRQVVTGDRVTRRAMNKANLTRPFTAEAKFQRAAAGAARETRFMAERRAQAMLSATPEYHAFNRAIAKLKRDRATAGIRGVRIGKELPRLSVEQAATRLHLGDVVQPRAGMSATQLRDLAVSNWEKELTKAEQGKNAVRTANARAQIETIKRIPDELLTLKGDSPAVQRVREAVQAGRDLNRVSQNRSVAAGVITRQTADEIGSRESGIVLGGQEWAPSVIKRMRKEGAPKSDVEAVRAAAIKATPELQQARSDLAAAEDRLRSVAAQSPAKVMAATRARDRYFKQVRKMEKDQLGLTPPKRPELVGDKGVYIPDRPVDPMTPKGGPRGQRGMSGPQVAKRSKGTLKRRAGFDMNPALLAHQARRAAQNVTGPMSPRALDELMSLASYKTADGLAVTGKRAAQLASSDPERVVLVNVGTLKKALAKLDHLPEGKFLDHDAARIFYGDGTENWLQSLPKGSVSNDYVAISKSAAEAWRESMVHGGLLGKYDSALSYWKGGLLAFSPKWYANNMIGNGMQYGILTGGDLRAIREANRSGPIREAISAKNPDIALATLSDEVGAAVPKGADAGRLMRTMQRGFKINNDLEVLWRRAAYLNRAKRHLRDEGMRFRGMSDAEVARAIENMPPSVARQVVRDVNLFLGDYERFKPWERNFAKRVIPFYSWLRTIGRLTLSLPFRSPVRTEALAVLTRAGTAGINPNDYMLPAYSRGALQIAGKTIPTWSANPFQSLVPFITGAGADNPGGGLLRESLGWATPPAQIVANQAFGFDNYGSGVFAPPGYGGTAALYGQEPQRMNPTTGLPESELVRQPLSEALLQAVLPGLAGPVRRAVVGERTAYDTTTTPQAILNFLQGSKRDPNLFYYPKGTPPRKAMAFNPLSSFFGVPVYSQNNAEVARKYREDQQRYQAAVKSTARAKRKRR